jgi:hypothetical protein
MDSLHLFPIPIWLPDKLFPELWAIIFFWKWKLEMKDIHKVLTEKTSNIYTYYIDENDENIELRPHFPDNYDFWHTREWHTRDWYTGNYWIKFEVSYEGVNEGELPSSDGPQLITVYTKCGIELMYPFSQYFGPDWYGYINLCEHLKENLGIDCPKNLNYKDIIKLCLTV